MKLRVKEKLPCFTAGQFNKPLYKKTTQEKYL
jgi:hypothetical protein